MRPGDDPLTADRYHIVACIPRGITPELTRRVGEIVHMAAYDVRLRLTPALPRSVANFATADEAIAAAGLIAAEGVPTAVFSYTVGESAATRSMQNSVGETED